MKRGRTREAVAAYATAELVPNLSLDESRVRMGDLLVHTGVVTLTKPNADGFATISFSNANELTWMNCTCAFASAALSVELKRLDSDVNVACAPCAAARP